MYKVFIDTNVFLRLYQAKEGNLTRIFEDISKLKPSIIFVDQVFDEFLRNRDKVLTKQIENISAQKMKALHVTPLIRSLDEFTELSEAKKSFDKKQKELVNKIKEIKDNLEEDTVYMNFYELYTDSAPTIHYRSDEIIDKAHKRMLVGNPPIDKEKNTIGDQIIWETLISRLEDDLIFITDDKTYENHISFLKNEYANKVHKDLIVTKELSFALDKIGETPSEELIEFEKEEVPKPLQFSEWVVVEEDGEVAYVTDGTRGGYMPMGSNPHISYLCPHCGNYGPWNGAICLSCGYRSCGD